MLGTTLLEMFMLDMNGRRKHRLQLIVVTSAGMRVSLNIIYFSDQSFNIYAGRPLYAELSPVTDFREACCRQNENGECNRGGFCNFMHLRLASPELVSALKHGQRLERKLNPSKTESGAGGWEPSKREGGRGRSASPSRRSSNPGEDRWTRK